MTKQSTGHALHELSAVELIEGYRRREFSPVEVARSVLGHIERWERHLQALYLPHPERALEQARASEQRWLDRRPLGPIDGVPLTLKENISTEGEPTPLGTAAAGASAGACCWPRPRCRTTACCPRAFRASIRFRAIPGTWE